MPLSDPSASQVTRALQAIAYLGAPTVISLFLVYWLTQTMERELSRRDVVFANLQHSVDDLRMRVRDCGDRLK